MNAGYFVLDPAAGAPGDPAGVGVYGGRLLSETVNTRPALILRDDARRTRVERLRWVGTVEGRTGRLRLDGIDRVPGLIRNCGGRDDQPTIEPLHDFTCTDNGELVAFTTEFGPNTPTGPGLEAILDRHSRVVSLRSPRGGPLLSGYRSVQATGDQVGRLQRPRSSVIGSACRPDCWADGDPVRPTRADVDRQRRPGAGARRPAARHAAAPTASSGRPSRASTTASAPSGIRGPSPASTPTAAPSSRPPTGAAPASLGLSITETGRVARALGMVDGMNLDGGGSTTMVVDGEVINQPSDATGERPVGDALLILP